MAEEQSTGTDHTITLLLNDLGGTPAPPLEGHLPKSVSPNQARQRIHVFVRVYKNLNYSVHEGVKLVLCALPPLTYDRND